MIWFQQCKLICSILRNQLPSPFFSLLLFHFLSFSRILFPSVSCSFSLSLSPPPPDLSGQYKSYKCFCVPFIAGTCTCASRTYKDGRSYGHKSNNAGAGYTPRQPRGCLFAPIRLTYKQKLIF